MMDLHLDWSTAEVRRGKLRVALEEKPPREWCASFERTQQLLNHGSWPDVKVKKGEIVVADVEPGDEEKLRFFLESVVQEANAAQAEDSEEASEETEEAAEAQDEDSPEDEADPDTEMTDRFRSFAS